MAAATQAPTQLTLTALDGQARTIEEWVTTFHLVVVVIDPYTNESSWIIGTAGRILSHFREADCRVAWLVTADADDARTFLGPWAKDLLTLTDPDRIAVKGLGIDRLPALVHIRQDLAVLGCAEGWDPAEWQAVTDNLARIMSWSGPPLPGPGDPSAFAGSPAQG
jgi:hypothetical protein